MANAGYDAVVDVDDEVCFFLLLAIPDFRFCSAQTANNASSKGRPRPHRLTRRPRIPQLQLQLHRAANTKRCAVCWPYRPWPATPRDRRLLLRLLEALPLDPVLLRPILRRRHLLRAVPLLGCAVPTSQLSRRARREPRSIRSFLDRYYRCSHPIPRRHH